MKVYKSSPHEKSWRDIQKKSHRAEEIADIIGFIVLAPVIYMMIVVLALI